jgi:hypothetical protein
MAETKLDEYFRLQEQKLATEKEFCNSKWSIFQSVLVKVGLVLESYGITEINTDDVFLRDTRTFNRKYMVLHINLKADFTHLSDVRQNNLVKKLQGIIPMPVGPLHSTHLEISYYD